MERKICEKCGKQIVWGEEFFNGMTLCHECLRYERIDNGLCAECGNENNNEDPDDVLCRECRRINNDNWYWESRRIWLKNMKTR